MNTVGVMTGGGVGKVMAEWISTRERPPGLAGYDVARAPAFQISRSFRHDRTVEALGVLYGVGWPNREYLSARGARRSPLHHWHDEKRAVMSEKGGWEVPLVYAPAGEKPELQPSYGHQNWQDWASEECRRALEAVVLFDLSAMAKLEISGSESALALADLSGKEAEAGMHQAIWPTAKGTIEAAVTIAPMDQNRYLVFSEPGSERRHGAWFRKRVSPLRDCSAKDMTAGFGVLLLVGPKSAAIIEAFRQPSDGGDIHIGYAPCRLFPCDHYGVEAWLVVTSTEFTCQAVEALERVASGALTVGGHYALEALRIRAGIPSWPRDLDDQVSVRETATTKLVRVSMAAAEVPLYGNEGILRDGKTVGQTTSGHWGPFTGRPEVLGFVSNGDGVDQGWFEAGRFEIDAPGGPYPAECELLSWPASR